MPSHALPPLIEGNRCTVLRDGVETFPAMLETIASARRFVHVEVFRFRDDPVGRAFAAALSERARAGVEVRVLVDGYGSFGTSTSFFAALEKAGCRIAVFRPVAPWRRRWGFYRRDHRKILVVDGRVAFAGGHNLDACHAPVCDGGEGWRDTQLRVEGPAVVELDRFFWDTWLASAEPGDLPNDLSTYLVPSMPCGPQAVQIVANPVRPRRSRIRRAYLEAIAEATRSAWLTNPYFLPDAPFLKALTDAVARGVDVRLLLPERSDVGVVDIASRPIRRALAARGVRIFELSGRILHAKTAVIDGRWTTVGSCNLDALSVQNLELNVVVRDEDIAATLSAMFLDDLRDAAELRPARVALPVHLRFAEWTLHGLRHWM